MSKIVYLKGDATYPQGDGPKIIAHICNNLGFWGKGFVLAISKRWQDPKVVYQLLKESYGGFPLGLIQMVEVDKELWVCNMIAQDGIYKKQGIPPIRYDAVGECLAKLSHTAQDNNASIHLPRIGAGLAGGRWEKIEAIINETLVANNIPVFVYDLKK